MSPRSASGVSARSSPASTTADTAVTRNSAPRSWGASSIATCASPAAAARAPRRSPTHARNADIATTVTAPPLARATQNRRSFTGTAGVEQHPAELDRGGGDRGRVLALLHDLSERAERVWRARAGERLAELEQYGEALAIGRRLIERAAEKRG